MNINASIIDQQINGVIEKHPDFLPDGNDANKKKSAAFVLLCMSASLDLPLGNVVELFTDGGNDAGVDGLSIGEVEDGEFLVTLFQGKYKINKLDGEANFPENGVQKAIHTITTLFDPARKVELNPLIKPKVEEIRSMVRDGYIPKVRVFLCNNGKKWNEQTQILIDQSKLPEDQVSWIHFNHDNIVNLLRSSAKVDDTLQFSGESVVEDFNFRRVLIGKVRVQEIAGLFDRHNDLLLERNIRRYLGLHSNRVNSAIRETLEDPNKRNNFYFFNNGITIICRKFRHNALQGTDYQVKLEAMHVINGGQTCKTIQQTLMNIPGLFTDCENTYVLVRIYELSDDDHDFVRDITYATNSQNPVDLRDLRSNDEWQKQLGIGIEGLGYTYKRQREERGSGASVITSSIVAESVLAIWQTKPHQAKFYRREHFGKLYNDIFRELNAAQAILAVLIFRAVENERKRPTTENPADFLPYASHYISMLIGQHLLSANGITIEKLSHQNFSKLLEMFESNKSVYYQDAIKKTEEALCSLYTAYRTKGISLQQLSATFRRGDLLEILNEKNE